MAFNVSDMAESLAFYCSILDHKKAFEITVPEGITKTMLNRPIAVLAGNPRHRLLKISPGNFLDNGSRWQSYWIDAVFR